MSVESMMEKDNREVPIAYFKRVEDAIRWAVIPRQKLEIKRDSLRRERTYGSVL
jgi:hypothetical protein